MAGCLPQHHPGRGHFVPTLQMSACGQRAPYVAAAALPPAGPTPWSLSDSPTPFGAFNSSLLAHPSGYWVTPTCVHEGPPTLSERLTCTHPFSSC